MGWLNRGEGSHIIRELLVSYRQPKAEDAQPVISHASRWHRLLLQAEVSVNWLYRAAGIVLFLASVSLWPLGVVPALIIIIVGSFVVYFKIARKARARRKSIDRDLPALLTSVASSVRAGMDPLSALLAAREYFPAKTVLVNEIEKMRSGLADGQDEEDLIEGFLEIFNHPDGELFKRCMILSRRHGGSLAEPLHRVTRVVRQRQSFRRKTSAALAMHRMSAIGIALCAMVIGAIQVGMNARGMEIALNNPTGSKFLIGGALLICTGVGWMMSMGSEARMQ